MGHYKVLLLRVPFLIFLEKILILYVSFLCAHHSLSVSSSVPTRKRKSLSSLESMQEMGEWLLEMGKHTVSDLKRKNWSLFRYLAKNLHKFGIRQGENFLRQWNLLSFWNWMKAVKSGMDLSLKREHDLYLRCYKNIRMKKGS